MILTTPSQKSLDSIRLRAANNRHADKADVATDSKCEKRAPTPTTAPKWDQNRSDCRSKQMPSEQSRIDAYSGQESAKAGEGELYYWRYFSDRADTLKDNLWTQVTWLLGLAGALIAFVLDQEIISWSIDGRFLIKAWPAAILGLIGVLLCSFALVLIWDTGNHISLNWRRQEHFSKKIPILEEVLNPKENLSGKERIAQRANEQTSSEASDKSTERETRKKWLPRVSSEFLALPGICRKLFAIVAGFMILFALCVLAAIARLAT